MSDEKVMPDDILLDRVIYVITQRRRYVNDRREIDRSNVVTELELLINEDWARRVAANEAESKLAKIDEIMKGEDE